MCIVCITSDNVEKPWLVFEAGALSKKLDGRVYTFLLDIEPSAVGVPLGQFQHTLAEPADVLALIESINKRIATAGELPRHADDLKEQFETLWPKFFEVVTDLRRQATTRGEAYGDSVYHRLMDVKSTYDPDNVFHHNQNIRPRVSDGAGGSGGADDVRSVWGRLALRRRRPAQKLGGRRRVRACHHPGERRADCAFTRAVRGR